MPDLTPADMLARRKAGDSVQKIADDRNAALRSDPDSYGPIPLRTLSDLLAADGRRSRLQRWVDANADDPTFDPLTSPAREVLRDIPDARYHFGPGSPHAAAVAGIEAAGGLPAGTGDDLTAASPRPGRRHPRHRRRQDRGRAAAALRRRSDRRPQRRRDGGSRRSRGRRIGAAGGGRVDGGSDQSRQSRTLTTWSQRGGTYGASLSLGGGEYRIQWVPGDNGTFLRSPLSPDADGGVLWVRCEIRASPGSGSQNIRFGFLTDMSEIALTENWAEITAIAAQSAGGQATFDDRPSSPSVDVRSVRVWSPAEGSDPLTAPAPTIAVPTLSVPLGVR